MVYIESAAARTTRGSGLRTAERAPNQVTEMLRFSIILPVRSWNRWRLLTRHHDGGPAGRIAQNTEYAGAGKKRLNLTVYKKKRNQRKQKRLRMSAAAKFSVWDMLKRGISTCLLPYQKTAGMAGCVQ